MNVTLTEWQESATCCWCEKSRECVTVTFSDGFLKDVPMCWRCLQTAFKVRSLQHAEESQTQKPKPQETS